MTAFLLAFYSLAVCAAAVGGGVVLGRLKLRHVEMQVLISFVGGLMLSIGVLHLLLHGLAMLPPERLSWAGVAVLAGMSLMFLLLRAFHFHHHGEAAVGHDLAATDPIWSDHVEEAVNADRPPSDGSPFQASETESHHDHDHSHDHASHDHAGLDAGPGHDRHGHEPHGHESHGHHHRHEHDVAALKLTRPGARYRWVGVLAGLSIHTLIDGIALAASTISDPSHNTTGIAGLATFLSIILHKPLDAISVTSLMQASGWSATARLVANLAFAAMCPLGAALFYFGFATLGEWQSLFVGLALAFSAGVFICIALSDLLPEMEFHSHHRVPLTIALLGGLVLGWALGLIEPSHLHAPPAVSEDETVEDESLSEESRIAELPDAELPDAELPDAEFVQPARD